MTDIQKVIKYCAIAFATILSVYIIGIIVSVVLGIFGIFTFTNVFFNNSNKNSKSNIETNNVSYLNTFDNVDAINISTDISKVYIKKGETLKVEAENVTKNFECNNNSGTLNIKYDENNKFKLFSKSKNNFSAITIYIPENEKFKNVKIESGVGNISIDILNTEKLDLELGVGNLDAENITSGSTKISGGVGKIVIKDSDINNLDLESGVGNIAVNGKITGETEINGGVGTVKLNINGNKNDYDIAKVEKGLGSITIDSTNQSEIDNVQSTKSNTIKVEGGVGSISINFNK